MQVPINTISWSLGGLALYSFTVRSWGNYLHSRNPLARIYSILAILFGTALFFFGLPGFFTNDLHILKITYFFADLFVQISLQIALWLLWFLGLRGRVRLLHLYFLTIPFSTVLMVLQALTSNVSISHSPTLIVYTDTSAVLILKSIIYVCIAIPLGYFLIREAPRQISWRAKLKSFIAGMTFIVVCLAATSNNILDKGSDTPQSVAVIAAFFVIFFLAQLPRPSPRSSNRA